MLSKFCQVDLQLVLIRYQTRTRIIKHLVVEPCNVTNLRRYQIVSSALDHALKSSHNGLPADLPVWDSLQINKQDKAKTFSRVSTLVLKVWNCMEK